MVKYLKISLICVPVGIIIGVLCFVFTYVLRFVNSLRLSYPFIFMPLLFLAGIIIVFIFKRYNIKNGMGLVFECGQKKINKMPLRLIPIISISTWLTNLCGGSCGREGVAVQIGATLSSNFSRFIFDDKEDRHTAVEILVIAGIGAGFAAMFQTPLAAICFALELVSVRKYKIFAVIPTIIESFVAYYTAKFLSLERDIYVVNVAHIDIILKVIIASILFGLCGLLFSRLIENAKKIYSKYVKNKYIGIVVSGIILSILFIILHMGRYSGTGANLIDMCFEVDGNIYTYDFILKLILTVLTLSVGFQGGEVTPLFTVGATLGFVIAKFFDIDTAFLASLGFISVFASATNTFFCPILLGVEIFGIQNLTFYIISVLISYIINFDKSIYPQEKNKNKKMIEV